MRRYNKRVWFSPHRTHTSVQAKSTGELESFASAKFLDGYDADYVAPHGTWFVLHAILGRFCGDSISICLRVLYAFCDIQDRQRNAIAYVQPLDPESTSDRARRANEVVSR